MGDKKTTPPVPSPDASLAPAASGGAQPPAVATGAPFVDAGPGTLANKPGEPPLKMALSVNKIEFKCADDRKPVSIQMQLHNPTANKASFKVRCTSADIFRVQPPIGCVKPNETVTIVIWYQNRDSLATVNKNHYFAFYHTRADARTAREVWSVNVKADGVRRIPVIFTPK